MPKKALFTSIDGWTIREKNGMFEIFNRCGEYVDGDANYDEAEALLFAYEKTENTRKKAC